MLSALLSLALAAEPADCSTALSVANLEERLRGAEEALAELDAEGFLARSDALVLALTCASEAIPPITAARVHRLQGLRLYIARDEEAAAAAFAAARTADPALSLAGLIPEGHALHELYGLAPVDVARLAVPRPREGALRLDGAPTLERADHRPVLFQHLAEDGHVLETDWVPVDSPLPPYDALPLPPGAGGPVLPRHRAGRAMLGLGVGLTVTAGALYGAAAASRSAFFREHEDWGTAELEQAQRRTNTLTTVAAVFGGVGLGSGAVGVVFAW
jgi:hypothetical protein